MHTTPVVVVCILASSIHTVETESIIWGMDSTLVVRLGVRVTICRRKRIFFEIACNFCAVSCSFLL